MSEYPDPEGGIHLLSADDTVTAQDDDGEAVSMTELNPSAGKAPIAGIIDSDDPWIAGYLKLRQAVLNGELETLEDIASYAAELRRDLPEPAPPPSIAAFIAADIEITFPLLTDALWTP